MVLLSKTNDVNLLECVFNERKALYVGPDVDVHDKMDVFTLAIVGLGARSFDQSKNGYGLKLVTVKVLDNNNIASLASLLSGTQAEFF